MAQDLVRGVNLGPEFLKGAADGSPVADKITIAVDGTTVLRDAATGVLSAVAPPADNFIQSGTSTAGDAGGGFSPLLTLVDGDAGTPDIVIDLTPISGVSSDAPQLLTIGNDGKPQLDPAAIPVQPVSTDPGNLLINGADGRAMLNPAAIPAQGVSGDAGNVLTVGGDGLPMLTAAALCGAIDSACVSPSTDVFGAEIANLRTF